MLHPSFITTPALQRHPRGRALISAGTFPLPRSLLESSAHHDAMTSLPPSWDRGQCQRGSSKAARSCTGRATASISMGAVLGLLQKTGMVRCLIKYVPPSAGALQQP